MKSGGLCGMATPLDPNFTRGDNLSGQVVARKGELPPIRELVDLEVSLMESMIGVDGENPQPVTPLRNNELVMVNVATSTSLGVVSVSSKKKYSLKLRLPICAEEGSRLSLSRRVGSRWHLIGFGTII